MNKQKLSSIIEGILFVAGNGIELQDIAEKLGVKIDEIKESVQLLKEKYTDEDGINVIVYKGKAQLTSNPKYAEEIATVLNPIKEKALTKAALETVAIIAYQQPVTRLDIEQVRGVSSDYAIQLLLAHNLIEVVGRKDAVGKPLLFGTTDEFLKRFEIESLDDLPKYEDLLEQIQVIKSDDHSLYHEFDIKPLEEDDDNKNNDGQDYNEEKDNNYKNEDKYNDEEDDEDDEDYDERECNECGILKKADKEKQEDLNTRVEEFSSENQADEKDINK